MATESKDRVRRHRLKALGYEGKPCPVPAERVEAGLTKDEKADVLAWADGVWKRQDEQTSEHQQARASLTELRAIAGGKK